MLKKGQITIFIIIAIVLVGVIGAYFVIKNFSPKGIPVEVQPVYDAAIDCIEKTGYDAVYLIGQQGGYYHLQDPVIDNISFYVYLGKNYIPSKNNIENQIISYMDDNLKNCPLNNLTGFQIKIGKIKTEAYILAGKIQLSVKYPLTITKGDSSYLLENFETKIPIDLDKIYYAANEITKILINSSESLCLSCLANISKFSSLNITFFEYDQGINIFYLEDSKSLINNSAYTFIFANKYAETPLI